MVPRRTERPDGKTPRERQGPGQDRRRNIGDSRHHPVSEGRVKKSHKPQKKKKLPPRHKTHTHPHGDELGPHINKPSPIKPRKTITGTGSKKA
jgi:hypothetical protein